MSTGSRVLLGAALAGPLLLRAPLPETVGTVIAIALLGILPGAALSHALGPQDPVFAVLITVAGSLAVTIAVSTVLLYLELWSATAAALGVAAVTVLVVLCGEGGRDRDLA